MLHFIESGCYTMPGNSAILNCTFFTAAVVRVDDTGCFFKKLFALSTIEINEAIKSVKLRDFESFV